MKYKDPEFLNMFSFPRDIKIDELILGDINALVSEKMSEEIWAPIWVLNDFMITSMWMSTL